MNLVLARTHKDESKGILFHIVDLCVSVVMSFVVRCPENTKFLDVVVCWRFHSIFPLN